MSRSSEQRIGDIAVALAAIAALVFVGAFWSALDVADGSANSFWSRLGLSMGQALNPAFAAACLFNWMDSGRTKVTGIALIVLHSLTGLATAASGIFGRADLLAQSDGATYVLLTAFFLMSAAGIALVAGIVPPQLKGLVAEERAEDETA